MKEHSKISELSNEEIDNLSDGEFKALVIKMLTELIELGRKIKEQMKEPKMKLSKIFREPTVTRRKQGFEATILEQKEEINI